ncbi:DUF4328 domain-containing protein [Brevundimonas sp.]|uniref:DUF4328 domain-containing protein n=1 Tax=Brevundimonas sp. TaxID=1871086 RepID=UPI002737CB92|nr:DUF4328 domain-containing protein [Brevundimonas sp.]MDP3802232.1 DUF4328 domain-containing protein [Brevundimonas sp.]
MATGKTYTTRPIATLGAAAALWLLINALADGFSVVLTLIDLSILSRLPSDVRVGFFDPIPDASGVLDVTGLGRLPVIIVYLATAFITLKWIYRASRNAHALGRGLDSDPPWVVGWFFVPIAMLWKPFEGMSETWRVSQDPEAWKRVALPGVMRVWWGFWLVSMVAGNISFQITRRVETIGGVTTATAFEALSALAGIVAGLALRHIVLTVSTRQTDKIHTSVF